MAPPSVVISTDPAGTRVNREMVPAGRLVIVHFPVPDPHPIGIIQADRDGRNSQDRMVDRDPLPGLLHPSRLMSPTDHRKRSRHRPYSGRLMKGDANVRPLPMFAGPREYRSAVFPVRNVRIETLRPMADIQAASESIRMRYHQSRASPASRWLPRSSTSGLGHPLTGDQTKPLP